jgi:excinuclease UvrABC nuclease subunit
MLRQELDNLKLPQLPGVYFWRNDAGTILYIGKATSLRERTRSYFAPDLIKTRGPRLVDMVFKSATVTWQETDSVLEALILEANLIKKHQPYYNRDEKDDKSFNCIAITKEIYPRILLVRQKDIDVRNKLITLPKQKGVQISFDEVFGPYPRGSSLKDALAIIRKIFPFRDRASAMKDKETFYRQIGLAPDVTSVEATKQYKKNIRRIKLIFQGKLKPLVEALKKEMLTKAKAEKFEEANELKQKIFALEHIQDVSLIKRDLVTGGGAEVFRIEAYDVAHLSGKQMVGVMTVVENATTNKNEYRKFIIRGFEKANDAGALREMLTRRLAHPEWPYPNAIVVDGNSIQMNVAQSVLKEVNVDIPVIAVTKDERHRPKAISGPTEIIELHKYAILLANSESHRFALSFHKDRRSKAMV